jgi:2-methylcitrate dehydratase PrpD
MTFDASHDAARMSSSSVRSLGERIDFLGPKPGQDRFAVTIEVETRKGTLIGFQDRNVPGRYENPMSRQEVESKALELMLPVVGDAQARSAFELIDRLESLPNLDELLSVLRV